MCIRDRSGVRQSGNLYLSFPMGRDGGQFQNAAEKSLSVLRSLPGNFQEFAGGGEIQEIVKPEGVGPAAPAGADRADTVFILQQAGVGRTVRIDQAVHAEIPIVREFSEIAAVPVDRPVCRGLAAVYLSLIHILSWY